MQLSASELILNADSSIYHLNLLPEDLAETVILVGDQNRVPLVSKYFDTLELVKGKREFITHTGMLNGTRISVVSTGIGADNIDIVINELDALVNMAAKSASGEGSFGLNRSRCVLSSSPYSGFNCNNSLIMPMMALP